MVTQIRDSTKQKGISGALKDKKTMYKARKRLSVRVLRKKCLK